MNSLVKETIYNALQKYWGYSEFRKGQYEIIEAIFQGNDAIGILPTGTGKSICYQLPASIFDGVTIVISPLIALMEDQVITLRNKKINAAYCNSTLSKRKKDAVLDNAIFGNTKLLYLSPESLKSELVINRLKKMNIKLIAIDEAHCISEWGHDFRPAYREIFNLKSFCNAPFLALSATATIDVVKDIRSNLLLNRPFVFKQSPRRVNLYYEVQKSSKIEVTIKERIGKLYEGSAILYSRSRRSTREAADYFSKRAIKTSSYHGGMSQKEKSEMFEKWMCGDSKLMVATNAFGMGIDKNDVRDVFHHQLPDSLENYIQEAGRAGRDGLAANCTIFYSREEIERSKKNIEKQFPKIEMVRSVYRQLAIQANIAKGAQMEYFLPLEIKGLAQKLTADMSVIYYSLQLLERDGFLTFSSAFKNPNTIFLNRKVLMIYLEENKSSVAAQFLKFLARSYEGIFYTYTRINLEQIKNKFRLSENQIIKLIEELKKENVLDAHLNFESSAFKFIGERLDSRTLMLSKNNFDFRKERKRQLLQALQSYCETTECRQIFIERYFGFAGGEKCGNCDNCKHKSNSRLTSDILLDQITACGVDMDILLKQFPNVPKTQVLQIIDILIQEGKLTLKNRTLLKQ